jgi:hypothetical protein
VPTYTGPGHASIYTGTTPYNHGIVANEWYDRTKAKGVNCVFDPSVQAVGNSSSAYGQVSPHHLETMTVTDQLKFTYPASNVYSISIKDRSAVLPGGHLSDGSYWFDYSSGKFITSTFYTKELPPWVQAFNQAHNADTYLADWELLHEPSSYSRSIDNSPYEVTIKGAKTPTLPYAFTSFAKGNYSQFTITPFANTLLTDLALELIQQERLGKNEATDMLCVRTIFLRGRRYLCAFRPRTCQTIQCVGQAGWEKQLCDIFNRRSCGCSSSTAVKRRETTGWVF